MRKTRLVILPTKCLHQMGFLLLFLSCPVIGDWGRIRPETENSHNAIQIDREGSCGMERDPPGGLLSFLDKDGSKQCRLSDNHDSNSFTERVVSGNARRNDVRRIDQQRHARMSERRVTDERNVRESIQRRIDNSRHIRSEYQTGVRRNIRSLSTASSTRSSTDRIRVRSSSLNRMESERETRERRSTVRSIRRENEREERKLYLNRRTNERSMQRRLNRVPTNERREDERATRTVFERREKERDTRSVPERLEMRRLSRSSERERQEVKRETNRRSIRETSSRRRESDTTRRQNQRQAERRLSLTRLQTRVDRLENRQSERRENTPETWKTRSLEFRKSKSEQRENEAGRRIDDRRVIVTRRSVSLPPKVLEKNTRDRRIEALAEGMEGKSRRIAAATVRQNPLDLSELKLKNPDNESLFGGVTKWMDLKTYDGIKTEDWTTNCVIGAVVYFLTTRQIKAV